jgi:hypothetical protein
MIDDEDPRKRAGQIAVSAERMFEEVLDRCLEAAEDVVALRRERIDMRSPFKQRQQTQKIEEAEARRNRHRQALIDAYKTMVEA